jgi:hypothetical protein
MTLLFHGPQTYFGGASALNTFFLSWFFYGLLVLPVHLDRTSSIIISLKKV